VATSAHGIAAPCAVYEVGGRPIEIGSRGFAEAIADAHAAHHRPRCMCVADGIEMYVARLAGPNAGLIVKRMPNTGHRHAPDCPSYEPPAQASGLGEVLGSAIAEDPVTGLTTLRLDFPLAKLGGRTATPGPAGDSGSATSDGTRLSLRGLLHYLWDQAELTRWQPGFAGRRHWATVRHHLLRTAETMVTRGGALRQRLYVPEVFAVDRRDEINARRLAQWMQAAASPAERQQLMLLIGEVKEIVPARYGYKAVIKHVPDQPLALDETLYRRLGRRFERELSLWGASDGLHMIAIATFGINLAGVPTVEDMSLMATNAQWIPVEDAFELQLVDRLVHDGRWFTKALRYNLARPRQVACATLMDVHGHPCTLVVQHACDDSTAGAPADGDRAACDHATWSWSVLDQAMPPLPPVGAVRTNATRPHSAPPTAPTPSL
jgi:hypothetical protein